MNYNFLMKTAGEENKSPLEDIAKLIGNIPEGMTETAIPYLSLMRCNRQTTFEPGVITPSFCVIVRGQKRIYLGEEILEYSAGDTLSSLVAIPATGMVVGATN
jgi:hypothetical protein